MGEVIELPQRVRTGRQAGRSAAVQRVDFYFDLASPLSYLAAERIEGLFAALRWVPSLSDPGPVALAREGAERRAVQLGLPLVWPVPGLGDPRAPMRVAALAVECGRGPAFVLAAGRLAFCGGFDLAAPEVLVEAATAAGLDAGPALQAASDRDRDGLLLAAGRRCAGHGVPAVRVGSRSFAGEGALEAAALAAASARTDLDAGRAAMPARGAPR